MAYGREARHRNSRRAARAASLALVAAFVVAVSGCAASAVPAGTGTPTPARAGTGGPGGIGPAPMTGAARAGPATEVSRGCGGQNAEVEAAAAAPHYVYETWIGCGGIGFARSTDSGLAFGKPLRVPGANGFVWDPAIAVAPDGTVYVAYMRRGGQRSYPVVDASHDHGQSFRQVAALVPRPAHNFGDRDFIAAGPSGHLYLTWDYGPSAAKVHTLCSKGGSCSFTAGDLNAVIQESTDGGRTWGPITPIGPLFPRNGGIAAPVLAGPGGRVDALYLGHNVSPGSDTLHQGHEYFTSSRDGATWPRHPLELWPGAGPIALREWWIDTSLAGGPAGDLYAAWDTQTPAGDTGWLSVSANGGRSWRRPVRVTPGHSGAAHIMAVVGGRGGVAYVGWQTSVPGAGYATYLRPYSPTRGWLASAVKVSPRYGNPRVWPGDTFGITTLPGRSPARLSISWGSALGQRQDSEIYAAVVTLR